MTTALDLTDKELAEIKALTKETEPAAALRAALVEYIRYAKRMRLKELSGQVEMQDNWQELEQAELDAQNGRSRAD
jgi:hypothetical protein